jgi:hypothetical protein
VARAGADRRGDARSVGARGGPALHRSQRVGGERGRPRAIPGAAARRGAIPAAVAERGRDAGWCSETRQESGDPTAAEPGRGSGGAGGDRAAGPAAGRACPRRSKPSRRVGERLRRPRTARPARERVLCRLRKAGRGMRACARRAKAGLEVRGRSDALPGRRRGQREGPVPPRSKPRWGRLRTRGLTHVRIDPPSRGGPTWDPGEQVSPAVTSRA